MTGTRSVLVVEPAVDRGGLADVLRREGLTVEAVNDARAAMAAMASARHGVVVVDLSLTGLIAEAIAETLRRVTPGPAVLVITDDVDALRSNPAGDVVHGCFSHRSDRSLLLDVIRDCATALRDAVRVSFENPDESVSPLLPSAGETVALRR